MFNFCQPKELNSVFNFGNDANFLVGSVRHSLFFLSLLFIALSLFSYKERAILLPPSRFRNNGSIITTNISSSIRQINKMSLITVCL